MSAVANQLTTTVRGVTITKDDVLRAMERFDNEVRATYPRFWKKYAVSYKGKLYPPKELLRLATGLTKVASGGEPTNKHLEALGFTVGFLESDESPVEIGTAETESEDEALISLEADIENALVSNLGQLESGLRLYKEDNRTGQQFQINFDATKKGRIDILAVDSRGDFVVVEIKAGEADRDVCGQIQGYMGWVKQHLAENRKVRGVIVANGFTVRAIYAAKVVPDLNLKKYQIDFSFFDA